MHVLLYIEMTKVAQAKSGALYFMEGVPKAKVCFMFCLKVYVIPLKHE